MHKPNNLLETDVIDSLDWDDLLDDARIVVSAKDGKVTLTGTVPTYYELTRAGEDAWSVGGVTAVDNELLVGLVGETIADAAIADAAVVALKADRHIPQGAVTVEVVNGWVTLGGEVRHHFQRQSAEFAVRRLDGVLGITDKIALTAEPIPSDVVDRINKAFIRNALIDDSRIEVTNVDHTIYLDGTAGSWAALTAAEDAAWAAPGVHDVVDRLVIVP
jgi:osmotically-inducible protein OsmY